MRASVVHIKRGAKRILQISGAFPIARSLYLQLSPAVRAANRDDRKLYSAFIKPQDLVFDVGVNTGRKSYIFLECGACVVGVEPNPLCRPTLQYMFGSNNNFTLVSKALAATEGRMVLHFVGTSPTASLREDWPWVGIEGSPAKAEVDVITLDSLIERYGVPKFCKIDVEGFELEVLRGLSQPLPCLSFEYHLTEADRLIRCIDYLAGLSEVRINAISMNGAEFVLSEWVEPTGFDFSMLPPFGDCFVLTSRP